MIKLAATFAVAAMVLFISDIQESKAQVVTTYYTPGVAVGMVPVRTGLFGWHRGYAPVVVGTAPVPVTTNYAPATVTTYYAPTPVATYYAARPVTTYYVAPAPVTTYYAPAPVTTYYAPRKIRVRSYYMPTTVIRY